SRTRYSFFVHVSLFSASPGRPSPEYTRPSGRYTHGRCGISECRNHTVGCECGVIVASKLWKRAAWFCPSAMPSFWLISCLFLQSDDGQRFVIVSNAWTLCVAPSSVKRLFG